MSRTVLVTGASSGIGRASAIALDAAGWKVFAGVRKAQDGVALQQKASETLVPVLLDITKKEQIAAVTATVDQACGKYGLDALVNNAGISVSGPLECIPLEDIRMQFEVNVIGQIAMTNALLPSLRRAHGRILFTSSIGGRFAQPFIAPYCGSKFAIEAIADALRVELLPWKIDVVLIEPGSIATPIWEKAGSVLSHAAQSERSHLYARVFELAPKIVAEQERIGIPVDVCANAILRALEAERPKARYLVGRDAYMLAWMRRLFPDKTRDKIIIWQGHLPKTEVEALQSADPISTADRQDKAMSLSAQRDH